MAGAHPQQIKRAVAKPTGQIGQLATPSDSGHCSVSDIYISFNERQFRFSLYPCFFLFPLVPHSLLLYFAGFPLLSVGVAAGVSSGWPVVACVCMRTHVGLGLGVGLEACFGYGRGSVWRNWLGKCLADSLSFA